MAGQDRSFWIETMDKMASPVLENLARRQLSRSLPRSLHPQRGAFAPLEAFGRTLCGIAPWLNLEGLTGQEEALRQRYFELARQSIDAATDSASEDFMVWHAELGGQPLVDAAFLSHALVRAPRLAESLDHRVRKQLIDALRTTRSIVPPRNNWLLFSAMVEGALYRLGAPDWDLARVDSAVQTFYSSWYKGDGIYGDGPDFHWDYYNSFVIQPMLVDLVCLFEERRGDYPAFRSVIVQRASRYAGILERLIGPDGSYPAVGRSLAYRFGAFQLLSQAALEHFLPEGLEPAQVRCGLTQVIRRVMEAEDNFTPEGWLNPGIHGCQPGLAERYINTGSLYLSCSIFLALGLPPQASFWSDPDLPWTGKRVWSGMDHPLDHAISQ